jgi:hypothetical protein
MKKFNLMCPVCSDEIAINNIDFEHVLCDHCQISFAGFELFDLLPASDSSDNRILPFGVTASKKFGLDILRKLLGNMKRVFELVVSGDAPGGGCSEEALMAYLVSLVEGQQGEREAFMPGSWTLVPHGKIPKSLYEELVHFPTYYAVGTLSLVLRKLPFFARDIAALRRSLERGLDFATTSGLAGTGYEWLDKRKQIFTIFERGKVLDLLREQPEISFRMCYVLGYIHQSTAEILSKTRGPITYQTQGPVARNVYERIAGLTEPFQGFCPKEEIVSLP